jgi:hypothetical protein
MNVSVRPLVGSADDPLPRRKFSPDEDIRLRALVDSMGTKSWEEIARFIPQRTARQCRDRYKNYLLESLMTDPWTPEEDAIVIQQFHRIGPKWVEIGKMLNGRSGNNVKNRWHKHLCRLETPRPSPKRAPIERPVVIAPVVLDKPPEPVPVSVQPCSVTEMALTALFGSGEAHFSVDRPWTSGFSLEDSLF